MTDISDKYNEACATLRRSRLTSRDADTLRSIPFQGLENLERDIDNHLTGRWLKSEIQACSVRLYMIFREIESSFDRDGSLREYARSLGETAVSMFNHIRGGGYKDPSCFVKALQQVEPTSHGQRSDFVATETPILVY